MRQLRFHLLFIVASSFFVGNFVEREDFWHAFFLVLNIASIAINTQCIIGIFRDATGEEL
jgi:hypothetical protein